jgi:sugar phosphate isomerase/epimerase
VILPRRTPSPAESGHRTTGAASQLTGSLLCWGCVPGTGLLDLAELAARHGFPEISVRPALYVQAVRADPAVLDRLEALGVAVGVVDAPSTCLPGTAAGSGGDAHPGDDGRDALEVALQAARGLRARTLCISHHLGDPRTDRDAMAAAVREVADRAGAAGVRVALEFIPGTGIPDLAAALDLVERTRHPDVGVVFDTWHFLRAGGEAAHLAALGPGQVVEAQISGRNPPAPGEVYVPMTGRLAPGEGSQPVADVVRALRAAQPDLVLGVEVLTAERGDPDGTVAHLAASTRAFLTGIGG